MKPRACSALVVGACGPSHSNEAFSSHLLSSSLLRDLLVDTHIPLKGGSVQVSVINNAPVELTVLGAVVSIQDDANSGDVSMSGLLVMEKTHVVLLKEGEWDLCREEAKAKNLNDYPPYWRNVVEGIKYVICEDSEKRQTLDEVGIGAPRVMLLEGAHGSGKTGAVLAAVHATPGTALIRACAANLFKRCNTRASMTKTVRFYLKTAILAKPAIVLFDDACFAFPTHDDAAAAAFKLAIRQMEPMLDGVAIVVVASPDVSVLHESLSEVADITLNLGPVSTLNDAKWLLARAAEKADLSPEISDGLQQMANLAQGLNPADILDSIHNLAVHRGKDKTEKEENVRLNLRMRHREARRRMGNISIGITESLGTSNQSFEFVGGLFEAKQSLEEAVLWSLQEPEIFERFNIQSSPNVLLYGPPGTGKTLLARHVVRTCDATMLSVDAAVLARGEVGSSEKILTSVFQKAAVMAPAIIFMDELDALFLSRDDSESTEGAPLRRLVSSLILALDNLPQRVAVLGASNRPWAIDSALLSAGRFDLCVYVPLPQQAARHSILALLSKRMDLPPETTETLLRMAANNVTGGWSGADLSGACRKAAMQALSHDMPVSPGHIRAAFSSSCASVDPIVAKRLATWRPP